MSASPPDGARPETTFHFRTCFLLPRRFACIIESSNRFVNPCLQCSFCRNFAFHLTFVFPLHNKQIHTPSMGSSTLRLCLAAFSNMSESGQVLEKPASPRRGDRLSSRRLWNAAVDQHLMSVKQFKPFHKTCTRRVEDAQSPSIWGKWFCKN